MKVAPLVCELKMELVLLLPIWLGQLIVWERRGCNDPGNRRPTPRAHGARCGAIRVLVAGERQRDRGASLARCADGRNEIRRQGRLDGGEEGREWVTKNFLTKSTKCRRLGARRFSP